MFLQHIENSLLGGWIYLPAQQGVVNMFEEKLRIFFEVVTFLSIMHIISISVKTNQIPYVRARTDHRVSVQLRTTAKYYLAVINFARKWNKTAY